MNNLQSLAVLAVAGVVGVVLYKSGKLTGAVGEAAGKVADFVSNPNPISDTVQNTVRTVSGNDQWYLSDAIAALTGLSDREQEYLAPVPQREQAAPLYISSTMEK